MTRSGLFGQIGRIVLDPTVADKQVRAAIYRQTTRETLREAVERTEALSRRGDDHGFGFLADRYNYLRQFTPQFLAAFAFRSNRAGGPILEAVASLRDLNTRRQRKLPSDAPVQFVPARWRPTSSARTARSIATTSSCAPSGNSGPRCGPATSGWRPAAGSPTPRRT